MIISILMDVHCRKKSFDRGVIQWKLDSTDSERVSSDDGDRAVTETERQVTKLHFSKELLNFSLEETSFITAQQIRRTHIADMNHLNHSLENFHTHWLRSKFQSNV
ncbi:Hypothetical predicted protein [Octopus vulgaris]|uniref:Uncharacterized protein n=1 Tax=Octopus vulgaris TaxID=6645 RepID=A0AA36AW66_OCTVU|nr:Hypothetical predicted protein [Octopus vulgaris]